MTAKYQQIEVTIKRLSDGMYKTRTIQVNEVQYKSFLDKLNNPINGYEVTRLKTIE